MPNLIATENARTGTPRSTWDLPVGQFGGHSSIQGYADGFSVDRSEPVNFKVAQTGTLAWTATIFRLGWYQGHGARQIAKLTPTSEQMRLARSQPAPADCDPATPMLSADCSSWRTILTWKAPADVPGGVFVARLTRSDGAASHILFVVRDDARRPGIRVQLSDPTWQAYNAFGGLGANLYAGNSLYLGTAVNQYDNGCARVVSYDRPMVNRGAVDRAYGAVQWSTFFTGEYPAVRWLERMGYDVAYQGGIDAAGGRGPNAAVAMMVGHNEYWTPPMRDAWLAHLRAGGHMVVCSSNEAFWLTRGERPDVAGRPRHLRCHKDIIGGRTSPASGWTGTWRHIGMPENDWTGTIFAVNGALNRPLVVDARFATDPVWRNTPIARLTAGQSWTSPPEILGFEIDTYGPAGTESAGAAAYMATPGPAVKLASLTTIQAPSGYLLVDSGQQYGAGWAHHATVRVRRDNGGLTFATGSINWALGLDGSNVPNHTGGTNVSPTIQQATANVLADMGVLPETLHAGLFMPAAVAW
jgi:hypothetical protein